MAVGIRKIGPAPHVSPPAVGCFGEKKKLCTVGPRPNCERNSGATSSWLTIGTMVREMRFQFSLIENGITGWMLSVYWLPSFGAKLSL